MEDYHCFFTLLYDRTYLVIITFYLWALGINENRTRIVSDVTPTSIFHIAFFHRVAKSTPPVNDALEYIKSTSNTCQPSCLSLGCRHCYYLRCRNIHCYAHAAL